MQKHQGAPLFSQFGKKTYGKGSQNSNMKAPCAHVKPTEAEHTGSPTWPEVSGGPSKRRREQPHGTGPAGPGSSALGPSAVILSQTGPPDTLSLAAAQGGACCPSKWAAGGHQHPLSSSSRWSREAGGPTGWARLAAAPAAGAVRLQNQEQSGRGQAGRAAPRERRPRKAAPTRASAPRPRAFHPQQTASRRSPHTGAYCSSSHSCRKLDPSGSPLAGEWRRTLWSTQRVEYYSGPKPQKDTGSLKSA